MNNLDECSYLEVKPFMEAEEEHALEPPTERLKSEFTEVADVFKNFVLQ